MLACYLAFATPAFAHTAILKLRDRARAASARVRRRPTPSVERTVEGPADVERFRQPAAV